MSIISEEELREVVEVVWMTVLDIPVDVGRADNLASCETTTAQITLGDVAWLDFTCGDHPLAVAVSEHASGAQQAA